jgi:precorrin-6A/cobalt-precorrin-6A reductase
MMRVLLLGGTAEAGDLARALAAAGVPAVYSYAGRTAAPMPQPLPVRVGGFGGAEGLAAYLAAEHISHVVDATHPFAAAISRNAVAACASAGVPLIGFERAAWVPAPGDRWTRVPDAAAAAAALGPEPRRVFLAIGRQQVDAFAAAPQHHYLLRLVDPPPGPLPLPKAEALIARGPFTEAGDRALMLAQRIEVVVAKDAGGDGAVAKIAAARALGLPVVLIDRPALPPRAVARDVAGVMRWLGHPARLGV